MKFIILFLSLTLLMGGASGLRLNQITPSDYDVLNHIIDNVTLTNATMESDGIDWTSGIGAKLTNVTNGTAAQDGVPYSQVSAIVKNATTYGGIVRYKSPYFYAFEADGSIVCRSTNLSYTANALVRSLRTYRASWLYDCYYDIVLDVGNASMSEGSIWLCRGIHFTAPTGTTLNVATNIPIFRSNSTELNDDVEIDGFILKHNGAGNYSSAHILLQNGSNSDIHHNKMYQLSTPFATTNRGGIKLVGGFTNGHSWLHHIHHNEVPCLEIYYTSDSYFYYNTFASYGSNAYSLYWNEYGNIFLGFNHITITQHASTVTFGLYLDGGNQWTSTVFRNRFEPQGSWTEGDQFAVWAASGNITSCVFAENVMEDLGGNAFNMGSGYLSQIIGNIVHRYNRAENANYRAISTGGNGFWQCTVSGNKIDKPDGSNTGTAIYISAGRYNQITNNNVVGQITTGLTIPAGNTDTGNYFIST
ncbi:hypothetical protein M0R72_21165 [Candidatus Pacearchaeota archaeon]|jgi:hypothetical protein|nr:hypothetical protein [Candidatus Pacearchaeota archaeon]